MAAYRKAIPIREDIAGASVVDATSMVYVCRPGCAAQPADSTAHWSATEDVMVVVVIEIKLNWDNTVQDKGEVEGTLTFE